MEKVLKSFKFKSERFWRIRSRVKLLSSNHNDKTLSSIKLTLIFYTCVYIYIYTLNEQR